MRKLLTAALFVLATLLPASADTINWYFGQNPPSESMNLAGLYQKVDGGVQLLDILDQQTAGFYTNLTLTPTGSAFLATMNPPTNSAASLYQLGVANPIILPPFCTLPLVTGCASGQIGVDNTKIFVHGMQKGNSVSIGPFTPSSTGGQSIAYLVEAQIVVQDQTNIAIDVYQPNGVKVPQTQPRDRANVIVYQIKASSSSVTPTVPTVDAGWVAIASIIVPNGTPASLSGSTIAAFTPFTGFPSNSAVVHLNGNDTGAIQVSGSITGSQFISTVSTGTPPLVVTSTTVVANLNIGGNAATATTLAACCLAINLGGNGTATPTLTSADANIIVSGSWSANVLSMNYPLVAPNLTTGRCVRSNGSSALVSAGGDCVVSVTTSDANVIIGGTATAPTIALNANPTFNSITSTTSVQAASVVDTGLTGSTCVRVGAGTILASAATDCISSVTASLPIVASISGNVLSVTCPTCSAGTGVLSIVSGSSGNISVVNPSGPFVTIDLVASPTVTGLTATANIQGATIIDTGLSSNSCVQTDSGTTLTSAAGGCIISVSAGPNIATNTVSGSVTVRLASPAPTAAPSSCAGWDGSFNLQTYTCSAIGPIIFPAVATPAPTLVFCANDNAATNGLVCNIPTGATNGITFATAGSGIATINAAGKVTAANLQSSALTSGRCVQAGASGLLGNAGAGAGTGCIVTVSAGSNIAVGTSAGTATVSVASPSPTSVPSACAGWSSSFVLQSVNGACAIVGTNKTTAVIERFVSGALTVAASVAFPLPSIATGFTVAATSFQCTTPGSSGTNTVQWQYTTTGDPTSASWTSITGATQSWTTAGGTVPSTFTGVNLTGLSVTWVRANITAVGAGPPSNCYLYLHGTQTVQ